MAEKANVELLIYVEDVRAKQLLAASMSSELRRRTHIVEVGSNSAVISQANARFVDRQHVSKECMFVLDGDQRSALTTHRSAFIKRVDSRSQTPAGAWFDERISFLPSDLAPERYVISQIRDFCVAEFAAAYGLDDEQEACAVLDKALVKGNHSEIHWIAEDLCFPSDQVWQGLCQIIAARGTTEFDELITKIKTMLSANG